MKKIGMLKSEDGSLLIIALIMLAFLSLIGISASRTSSIELLIAGNERIYKQNLYMAEASAMENVQRLENGGTEMSKLADPDHPVWLLTLSSLPSPNDITDPDNWTNDNSQTSLMDSDTRFLTIYKGIDPGDSLDLSKSRLFTYGVIGRSIRNNGLAIIDVGYKRAF